MSRNYKEVPGNPSQVFRGSVPIPADLPNDNELGDVWSVEDIGSGIPGLYIWNGSAWTSVGTGAPVVNVFSTIQTDNGTYPVADSATDTLILTSSDGSIDITGDQSTDTANFTLPFTPEDVTNKVQNLSSPNATTYPSTDAVANAFAGIPGNSFETVSKNLKAYDYTLNYTLDTLTSIDYTVPSVGTITKTLNYTLGQLTSVVISGPTPSGITLTKTLNYTLGQLTSIAYT